MVLFFHAVREKCLNLKTNHLESVQCNEVLINAVDHFGLSHITWLFMTLPETDCYLSIFYINFECLQPLVSITNIYNTFLLSTTTTFL